jgi:glyoxylase-like metal-dependent hydrolase (beta-lactamase superfamily II)
VPIHLHAADRQWVTRADPAVQFWEGDTKPIGSGLTLVRLGGHFDGGTVLHWADWSEGRGVLLSGDSRWSRAGTSALCGPTRT